MAIFLTEGDVGQLLTMDIALEAVEEAFKHQAAGTADNSPRSRLRIEGGFFNLMAAAAPGLGVMGQKAYAAVRGGLRHFYVHLYGSDDGALLAVFEASGMGQVRTGAASGVATKYMARPDAQTVGVIGSGYQAQTQLEAVCRVRDVVSARVFSRKPERRQRFAKEMSAKLDIDVSVAGSAEECVRDADIVITITTSAAPVLEGRRLSPGTHVNAAGANHWMRREIDDETVSRAGTIVADDVEQAKTECGDLMQPIERGLLRWEDVRNLYEVVSGAVPGRTDAKQITLFASQGMALEDIAVGARLYKLAKERGVGTELPL